ncbi:hypothetical protein D3C79_812130 [compost metagenome]
MQLSADVIGADFALDFHLDRIEAALEPADPQPCSARGAGQALGAEHQQRDEADEQ